jgi:hypothetical protein
MISLTDRYHRPKISPTHMPNDLQIAGPVGISIRTGMACDARGGFRGSARRANDDCKGCKSSAAFAQPVAALHASNQDAENGLRAAGHIHLVSWP